MKIRSAAGGCSLSMRRKRDKFSKIKHHTQLSAGYQSIKNGYNLSCVHYNWWRDTKKQEKKIVACNSVIDSGCVNIQKCFVQKLRTDPTERC